VKRIAAIHDISGVGKCSLTAAIPIISALGIEVNPVPTAILSTHTGDIKGYTFRDLTDEILPICRHWKELGIYPDTVYSGYLGSSLQIDAVKEIINMFSDGAKKTFVAVDPAMADSGVLYKGFDSDFPALMTSLCEKADIIVPNITEACLMTGTEYREEYGREYIEDLADKLEKITKHYLVITGVSFEDGKTGCFVSDKTRRDYFFTEKYPGTYYGTGDIFASVLTGLMTKGINCFDSAKTALKFTADSIADTYYSKTDPRFGVAFEKYLPQLTKLQEDLP